METISGNPSSTHSQNLVSKQRTHTHARNLASVRIRKGKVVPAPKAPKYDSLGMDKADFLAWERDTGGWKYEWNNGRIEINEVNTIQKEQGIVIAIIHHYERTFGIGDNGAIFPETDCEFEELGTMRRPDLAYFTREQIQASKRGKNPIPPFVIELVSKHDKNTKRYEKLIEYFTVGVKTVWYIYPEQQIVEVYTSPTEVRICTAEMLCSAAPALPDFSLTPNQLFV